MASIIERLRQSLVSVLSSTGIAAMFNRVCSSVPMICSSTPEAVRRAVAPPIQVQTGAWSSAGELDWWVMDWQEWFGRVRGPNGRQRWIKAADLRPREPRTAVIARRGVARRGAVSAGPARRSA